MSCLLSNYNGSLRQAFVSLFLVLSCLACWMSFGSAQTSSMPVAPTNLSATSTVHQQVDLSWTASPDATSYKVKRSTTGGGPYSSIATVSSGTTYTNTGLSNATTYYYVVSSLNGTAEGLDSSPATVTTPALGQLTGVNMTPGDTQIAFSWNALAGATYYQVYRSTSTSGPFTLQASPTTPNHTDSGLTNGTRYYYRLRGANSGGPASSTLYVSLNAVPLAPPVAPNNLTATAGDTKATLSWGAVPNATSYKIFRSLSSGTYNFAAPLATVSNGTNYEDTGLTNGTTYFYLVQAENTSGSSGNSNEAFVWPRATYLASLTINPSTVIGGSASTGTLTLSNPAPVGGATVILTSNTTGITVPQSVAFVGGETQKSFGAQTTSVSQAVTATIAGSCQGWTQTATLTALPSSQSFNVINVSAVAGNTCTTLTWSELPDGSVQGYHVYRRIAGGTSQKLTGTPQASGIYVDTSLTNGTTYEYQVSAVAYNGVETGASSWVAVTPSAAIPSLAWVNPPTTATGEIELRAVTSTGGPISAGVLLVDGKKYGEAYTSSDSSVAAGTVITTFDAAEFSDGSHIVQIVGYFGNSMCATPPITVQTSNGFAIVCENALDVGSNDLLNIKVKSPQGASWRLEVIKEEDNSVIRSWQGVSSAQLSWDGTNGAGNKLDDTGDVVIELSELSTTLGMQPGSPPVASAYGSFKRKKKRITLYNSANNPSTLILINQWKAMDTVYAAFLKAKIKATMQSDPSFHAVVLFAPDSKQMPKKLRLKIRTWLYASVTNFYIFSHGHAAGPDGTGFYLPAQSSWGGLFLWSEDFPAGSTWARDSANAPEMHAMIPSIVQGRPYNFVMIDSCHSAGGTPDDNSGSINYAWRDAFSIGNTEFYQSFLGWNGGMFANQRQPGVASGWLTWRKDFWNRFLIQAFASQAITYANSRKPQDHLNIEPWDPYRMVHYGDTQLR
jgi:fibronectin type 3 domain-containing protein